MLKNSNTKQPNSANRFKVYWIPFTYIFIVYNVVIYLLFEDINKFQILSYIDASTHINLVNLKLPW